MNNLKKLLLIFTIIISISLINNKTYAQVYPNEEYTYALRKISPQSFTLLQEYTEAYEFEVRYFVQAQYTSKDYVDDDYYFITSHDIPLQRGDNGINSYRLTRFSCTYYDVYKCDIYLRIMLDRNFVDENYSFDSNDDNYIWKFFSNYSVLYLRYNASGSSYNNGYTVGYSAGEEAGYNKGYEDGYALGLKSGYQDGYNSGYEFGFDDGHDASIEDESVQKIFKERYKKGYQDGFSEMFRDDFEDKFYIWIIPAIILVFGIGIFVSYRKVRE